MERPLGQICSLVHIHIDIVSRNSLGDIAKAIFFSVLTVFDICICSEMS